MRAFFGILFLLGMVAARADTAATSRDLVRLDQLVELVDGLAQSASNDTGRADCIAEYLVKIKGLATIAHTFADANPGQVADTNSTTAAESRDTMIQSACARAVKLAVGAANCLRTSHSDKQTPALAPASPSNAIPPVTERRRTAVVPLGDEATCLTQAKLAALLAQALNLETKTALASAMPMLAQRAIEPLGGWRADQCVTLGDFCVVVARVLNLKVESPTDPAGYIQAVRNDGLPVDDLLVHRPLDVLHESAVRAFLGRGYAAPLPSSRRRQPD